MPTNPLVRGLFERPVELLNLLDEIPLGLALLDPQRRIIAINRTLETLTGFVSEEIEGIHCRFVLRSNLCIHDCPLDKVSQLSAPTSVQGNIVNKSRQRIQVRLTASAIEDGDGHVLGFLEAVENLGAVSDRLSAGVESLALKGLVGSSSEIQRIFQILPVIALTDSSVLITGQTGTGKDLVAETIHQLSDRAKGPFIKVNCGALPEALLESELFGYEKGAFTGAVTSKPGRFRMAHNGTLYLTEIGDLPLSLQVKLLSFLDDKTVHPLGSSRVYTVDVRVIAATHRNLDEMVKKDKFRQDLLFRLNVIRLHLPPLVQRGADVRVLLDHFLKLFCARFNKTLKGFSPEAHRILLDYCYPGNVRELRNIVEYAVNFCDGRVIEARHLPQYLTVPIPNEEIEAPEQLNPHEENNERSLETPDRALPAASLDWADVEKKLILEAMTKARGRKGKAAAILGWGRSTLWRKMKKLGLVGK